MTQQYSPDNIQQTNPDVFSSGFFLVGQPQVRQLRISNRTCVIPKEFDGIINTCYDRHFDFQDKTPIPSNPNGMWAYPYIDPPGRPYFIGQFGDIYPGGGFCTQFNPNETQALGIQLQVQKEMN